MCNFFFDVFLILISWLFVVCVIVSNLLSFRCSVMLLWFWLCCSRNIIRNVMIVVLVLIINCYVLE